MSTVLTPASATSARHAPARPGRVLALLLLGQFMAILDVSIVNVAAPTIRTDLGTTGAQLQLVVAGYTISYAMLLVTGARLGDRVGHGRAFRAGLALFTAASLACGLAPTALTLIVFRVVQGVGAAVMMPQVMSLIQRTFAAGPARARALSLYSAVIACGAVIGQVLGGVLVSADIGGTGWRPVFLVNVPIGAALLALARTGLPADRGDAARRLDPAGVATLSAAVLALVLPLVLGHDEGWPAWCFVLLAVSVALFGVFVAVERSVGRRGGSPLVTARILRVPGLALAAVVLLLSMLTYGGFLFSFALHVQSGLGYGPAKAGLTFAPMAAGFALTGLTWQRLPLPWHGRVVPSGLLVAVACYLLLALDLHGGASVGPLALVELFVLGGALGLAFSPMLALALRHVPIAEAADASGVLVTVVQLGQVIGVATIGTLFLSDLHGVGARASGSALGATYVALAVCTAVAAAWAVALVTRSRRSPTPE